MLTSSDTTCLESAEWSGQDNLQCWTGHLAAIVSFLINTLLPSLQNGILFMM